MLRFARLSVLQKCLLGSALVHVGIFGFKFVDPEGFDRVFKDQGLEVILVNAKGQDHNDKPKALAQTSLLGGGDEAKGRATSALQASLVDSSGESIEEIRREIEAAQTQQNLMLTQLQQEKTNLLKNLDSKNIANGAESNVNAQQMQRIKLIAELEKRINEFNEKPRKRFVGPSTVGTAHAFYYQNFKNKVESLGTKNFPSVNGKKLYGELTLMISIDKFGQVSELDVMESTGDMGFDRMAMAIVRKGAPYGQFTELMLKKFQVLVVVSRFRFTKDDGLQTTVVAQ